MGFWKAKSFEEGSFPADSDENELAESQSEKAQLGASTISKPFNLMSVEELLETLPACSAEVINELWIPEMSRKIDAMKAVMQSVETHGLPSYESLATVNKVNSPEQRAEAHQLTIIGASDYWS
jgi:hypothetical protein